MFFVIFRNGPGGMYDNNALLYQHDGASAVLCERRSRKQLRGGGGEKVIQCPEEDRGK